MLGCSAWPTDLCLKPAIHFPCWSQPNPPWKSSESLKRISKPEPGVPAVRSLAATEAWTVALVTGALLGLAVWRLRERADYLGRGGQNPVRAFHDVWQNPHARLLLIVFLTAFGLIGLTLQSFVMSIIGFHLPAWMAVVPAAIASLPVVRICGGALAALIPNDETDAVSSDTFIGRIAVITLGTASAGSPAEAKLTDEHGHIHYIMVEPDEPLRTFEQGSSVLLTEHHGAVFKAIVSRSEAMRAGH